MSKFPPSTQQQAVLDQALDSDGGNIVLKAVAGSGKTTTLMMLLQVLSGDVIIVAFNRSIAYEIGNRVKKMTLDDDVHVDSRTVHSAGMRALLRVQGLTVPLRSKGKVYDMSFPSEVIVKTDRQGRDTKYPDIIREYVRGFNLMDSEEEFGVRSTLRKMVDLVRLNLVNPANYQAILKLAHSHNLKHTKYCHHVIDILKIGMRQFREDGIIDYTDMVYLPVRFGIPIAKYDWVLVDECQDLSPLQLEFVKRLGNKASSRWVFVGDPKQAIYAFAGADAKSFDNIVFSMDATVMPLSVCYRCGKNIIAEAQKLVPYIQHYEGNADGEVTTIDREDFISMVRNRDLVLARLNAPLIQMCLTLVAMGERAGIRGRELGSTLKSFVKSASKLKGFDWDLLDDYLVEEVRERMKFLREINAADSSKAAVIDLYKSVKFVLASMTRPPTGLIPFAKKVDEMFKINEKDEDVIWLSSIHKSKGLEARRTFLLAPERLPLVYSSQTAEERDQEDNLKYVAVTRSIDGFFYVASPQDEFHREGMNLSEILELLQQPDYDISEYLLNQV